MQKQFLLAKAADLAKSITNFATPYVPITFNLIYKSANKLRWGATAAKRQSDGKWNSGNKDDKSNIAFNTFLLLIQSWDNESTPLQPNGEGPAKFIDKPCDKWSGQEKETIFAQLEVFGNPVPKVTWFKGFKDLSSEGARFKQFTDGKRGMAILGIQDLKQEDEGAYKCVLNQGELEVEHEFSIYVTGMPTISLLIGKIPIMCRNNVVTYKSLLCSYLNLQFSH